MIFGYYCLHPELVDGQHDVARLKCRLERLTELAAPEIIIVNERRVYEKKKAFHSDLPQYRKWLEKLYSDKLQDDMLDNYRVVFDDVGFEPALAYPGNESAFDAESRDFLKPLMSLTDNAVLGFIAYTQHKFTEYYEKYSERLETTRNMFVSRIESFANGGYYPTSMLQNIARLHQTVIEISDGFDTTLEGYDGLYNAHLNRIAVSASAFNGKDASVLFHEFFHAIAGVSEGSEGFHRFEEFFDSEYHNAFNLLNEAFVNAQSITLLTSDPSPFFRAELTRDHKLETIIRRTGNQDIPRDVFFNAYFSDDMADVETLADAIKSAFNADELFKDLESIKNIRTTKEAPFKLIDNKKSQAKYYYHHRHDSIGSYFMYRFFGNQQALKRALNTLIGHNADDPFQGESNQAHLREALNAGKCVAHDLNESDG